ncbi:MAG: choice-of-anchor Q domain-containing protein [Acidimicrobiales bacterium]
MLALVLGGGLAGAGALGIGAAAASPALASTPSQRPIAAQAARPGGRLEHAKHVIPARPVSRPAPRFRSSPAAVTTFTVNSTVDAGLASLTGTTCVDSEVTPKCSLRAAVEAADNLAKPVKVVLKSATYNLTLGTLEVTDGEGLSITGTSEGSTTISVPGSTSGIFVVERAASNPAGSLFLSDLSLSGGLASDGGALYAYYGASAVLDKVALTHDTASGDGGAIYDYEASVWVYDSFMADDVADEGGAIWEYYGNVYLTDDSIVNDSTGSTGGDGAGIYVYYGDVTIVGGMVNFDTAGTATASGDGGGIYNEYGLVSITGAELNNDLAQDDGNGGAYFGYLGQLTMTGGSMSHDRATGTDASGGGIYAEYGSDTALHGVKMTSDSATGGSIYYGGGAIYDYSYEYATSLTIDQHSSITDASGPAVLGYSYYGGQSWWISDSTFSGNTASAAEDCGGAICALGYEYGPIDVSLLDDVFSHNTAAGDFTAGAVESYGYYYSAVALTLDHDLFSDNHDSGEASSGAALLFSDEYALGTLESTDSTFLGNTAPDEGFGGAVDAYAEDEYAPVNVSLTGDLFKQNRAGSTASGEEGSGGALYLGGYGTSSDVGSTFLDNSAIGTSSEGGSGGAVDIVNSQSSRWDATVFKHNTATGDDSIGGALITEDYYAGEAFDHATFAGNSADYGGAFYDETYATRVTASTFSDNTAGMAGTAGYGGAIYDDYGPITVTNSTFTGNTARSGTSTPGEGGAIDMDYGPLNLEYSTVSGNVAAQGGGVYEGEPGGGIGGSIVSGNLSAAKHTAGSHESDCAATSPEYVFVSLGNNVFGQSSCVTARWSSDRLSTNPKLGPLAFNGGPTETMALLKHSAAIGNGGTTFCPSTDERGVARPQGPKACDSGAYELTKKH